MIAICPVNLPVRIPSFNGGITAGAAEEGRHLIIDARLLSHAARLVGIQAIISDPLPAPVWNVSRGLGRPVRGLKGFG